MKEKWKAYLKNMKREQLVVYGLLLILLVVIALPVKKSDKKAAKEETVVKDEGQIGNKVPYVVAETYPEVRGVLVICQGGDNPVVIQQISEGVMALFRVEAHKIKVMKMK